MRILLNDIETAPHRVFAWGLFDQNIAINQIEEPGYTLSWAAQWYDEKKVMYSDINDGEEEMLKGIYDLVDEADVVVTYYGKKFDLPTLNKEWVARGWAPPSPYAQIDLCEVVKRRFKFPSNKLDFVSKELGIGQKVQHKGMDLWRGCMEGDEASWKVMKRYNKQDVVLLRKLYDKLLPWIPSHPNHGIYDAGEEMVCPHCGSKHLQKRGIYHSKALSYQRFQCQDCHSWSKSRKAVPVDAERRAMMLAGV